MARGKKKLKRGRMKWSKKAANQGRKGAHGKRKKFKVFAETKKQR